MKTKKKMIICSVIVVVMVVAGIFGYSAIKSKPNSADKADATPYAITAMATGGLTVTSIANNTNAPDAELSSASPFINKNEQSNVPNRIRFLELKTKHLYNFK